MKKPTEYLRMPEIEGRIIAIKEGLQQKDGFFAEFDPSKVFVVQIEGGKKKSGLSTYTHVKPRLRFFIEQGIEIAVEEMVVRNLIGMEEAEALIRVMRKRIPYFFIEVYGENYANANDMARNVSIVHQMKHMDTVDDKEIKQHEIEEWEITWEMLRIASDKNLIEEDEMGTILTINTPKPKKKRRRPIPNRNEPLLLDEENDQ